jgi:putative FmdB family regulatory protein
MPTYAYRCDNCGVQFDRYQAFSEPPLETCPECGEPTLRKLYAPVGIVFKGSGFYATDHRSPSGQKPSKKSESSEPASSTATAEPKPSEPKSAEPKSAD